MKSAIKFILHKLLGFKNYLYVFSLFKINTLKQDKNEKDFFHFLSLIPENTSVLDVGANIGIMTVHMARVLKGGKVYSFEPIPNNVEALKRVVSHYELSNVKIVETALGDSVGDVDMVMPIISSVKMQGLSHVVHKSIEENNEGLHVNVPINRLDDLDILKADDNRISAIKIDVENFEFFVLKGGENLIEQNKPVIYAELWDNENRVNCFGLLKMLKYNTFVIVNNQMLPYDSQNHKTQNFIFIPA